MRTIQKYLTFVLIFTQTSCYNFINPKLFTQSLPSSSRTWTSMMAAPYPLRAYQRSIPVPFLGHYYSDPYYPNNPDYFFPHDSYDDDDYYSNVLYFMPTGRRNPFYQQTLIDPIEETPDYDDEPAGEDNISTSQRDWWLEKNVAANEDTDVGQFSQVQEGNIKNEKTGPKTNSRKNVPKNRYAGIDGFGRKKDQELYANYRPTARKEERTSVYGVPVQAQYEDRDVRDLKSLLKNSPNYKKFADSSLAEWASGNVKRSASKVFTSARQNSAEDKFMSALKSVKPLDAFSIYDEGGQEIVPENFIDQMEEPNVFDKIKKLLALEDQKNEISQEISSHKLLKRKPPVYKPQMKNKQSQANRSRSSSSTTQIIPTSKPPSTSSQTAGTTSIHTNKRSIQGSPLKLFHANEDSLVRELGALRYRKS